ncbi:DUF892 family protein [Mesorhizobium sp. L48C026A00]|uniref:DUF892 family protein n=1 Tax=Mesorhizobium sp. L48C026A00 TaxID=1287182 RepID=UPI0003D051E1|nr:hypothetical protein X737_40070 [Mesorhizobium sp. L48C026A00]
MFAGDEVMKGSLASYTFEHMEIASYKMLIAAAGEVGDAEVQRVCEENLREEVAMADWLENKLGTVTTSLRRKSPRGSRDGRLAGKQARHGHHRVPETRRAGC